MKQNRTLSDVFKTENFNRSVLIGYYGGGNYGDELLLEVLQNLFATHSVKRLTVTYQHPERYATYHHDFGYERVNMADKKALFKTIIRNKNIVLGGGGLWGMDVNANIFLLSGLLFVSRWILRKKVYLLGVGYYSSTNTMGHLSAWLAAMAATTIVARDQETVDNFRKFGRRANLDHDIAYMLPRLDVGAYEADLANLLERITITGDTLFIGLRRFKANQSDAYLKSVETIVAQNRDRHIVMALLEPASVDPTGYRLITDMQARYPQQVQALDFTYNPVALYLLFKKYSLDITVIAPQFHVILTADLAHIPFMPMYYDNKVAELLKRLMVSSLISFDRVTAADIQSFVDQSRGRTP